MKLELAPVVVFTFKRLDNVKALLDSLGQNEEAAGTDLYIYSDLNEKKEDEDKVTAVRDFLRAFQHRNNQYKSITVIEAASHKGLAASVISGVTEILDKYGRVIVLEDDLIVSGYFLSYMNQCLDFYENDARIWSVSGYSPYVAQKEKYDKNVYLDYRASSWGWGTWKDRWEKVDWNVTDYQRFRYNPVMRAKFSRGGNDLPSMLREQMKGRIDSWAVRWVYSQSKNNMYSIAPVKTMVVNNGFGGDASNTGTEIKDKFGREELCQEFMEWKYQDIPFDKSLAKAMRKKYGLTVRTRIEDFIIRITK